MAASPWSERATLSRHLLTGGGPARSHGPRDSMSPAHITKGAKRLSNDHETECRQCWYPAAVPREDTAGSNATEERGSTDATRRSSVREPEDVQRAAIVTTVRHFGSTAPLRAVAPIHRHSDHYQNARRPDNIAERRPTNGQNPPDSGTITRESLSRARCAGRRERRGFVEWAAGEPGCRMTWSFERRFAAFVSERDRRSRELRGNSVPSV